MQTISTTNINVITEAVKVLKEGGLIIYPTETCYGVGVDATNPDAVGKLLEYKRRPEGKAISIAVSDINMAKRYVNLNDIALNIYKNFLPGPVTVISKITDENPGNICLDLASENGNLGIRIPKYELIREIIEKFDKPITATSANINGGKTPYSIPDILENMSNKQKELIDLIIDGGDLPYNPPSSVVDTTKDEMKTLREGSVSFENKVLEEVSNNEENTKDIAIKFMSRFKTILESKCLLILFNAEMGAGKTVFVKSLAKGLGVKDIVRSPTYSLMKEYIFPNGKLIHLDAWRIESEEEFEKLKVENYLIPNNVVAIEWAGGISNRIREKYINQTENNKIIVIGIDIEYLSETSRKIIITKI